MSTVITRTISLATNFEAASAPFKAEQRIEANTNCYSYALGIPEHGMGAPGHLTAQPYTDAKIFQPHEITSENIHKLMTEIDGLKPVELNDLSTVEGTNIIAAFICANEDAHFYRRHEDGTWSHHRGGIGGITNRDAKGDVITNPRTARRGIYNDFVGYYALPDAGLTFFKEINCKI